MGRLYGSVEDAASDDLLIFVWSLLPTTGKKRPEPPQGTPAIDIHTIIDYIHTIID
jgi:hypothetical protein